MKHIHFVIYRLKSIINIYCYLFNFFFLLIYFVIICIYSEIEFIKPLEDVKIQRKTITFTKDWTSRTVFISKMINSGIMKMFFFFFKFYIYLFYFLAKCYAFAQMNVVILV
jgi:hypothetical protein